MLYYGDEIGMGDNIWLGDRDGVRTPMQWTPDRNAGFSTATPGRLHLPAIQDPVFGYQRVNVETELENASSLLHWTRRMIHTRKKHPAFGLGDFTDLGGSNPSVLSYVREHVAEDGTTDTVLCVNNLSRFPQPVELDLRRWEGVAPIELLGGVRFPEIGELPYLLTLGGYGFYWFRLPAPQPASPATGGAHSDTDDATPSHAYLETARWFGGKGRDLTVTGVHRRRRARRRRRDGPDGRRSSWSRSSTPTGDSEIYQMPLVVLRRAAGAASSTRCVGGWDDDDLGEVVAYDAVHDREATRRLAARRSTEAAERPLTRGDAHVPPAARARPRPRARTPRCSPASRATPRWRSARTA